MAYIVNKFGIIHTIPDDWQTLPLGARVATPQEIAEYEAKDKETKRRILADKRARAAQKAQLVVVTGGADNDEPEMEPVKEPKANGK